MNTMSSDIENALKLLQGNQDFKVLQRMQPFTSSEQPEEGERIIRGTYSDTETTGFNSDKHEIIELALVPFTCTTSGKLLSVKPGYCAFNEPQKSEITEEITRVTGITLEMVLGHSFDQDRISSILDDTDVVVTHNAAFDRPFLEKINPKFELTAFACSMAEIPWKELGFGSQGLEYLCLKQGFFYDAHRAETDCLAALTLLATPLPNGDLPIKVMLDKARKPTFRVWAVNAPFDMKDILKTDRKYQWNDGEDGRHKAWWKDFPEDKLEEECRYLRDHIYRNPDIEIHTTKITSFQRYSKRV